MATGNFRDLARILDAEQPARVLLDLVLPGSDGIELMAQVPALAELPVIFISAYDRDETTGYPLAHAPGSHPGSRAIRTSAGGAFATPHQLTTPA